MSISVLACDHGILLSCITQIAYGKNSNHKGFSLSKNTASSKKRAELSHFQKSLRFKCKSSRNQVPPRFELGSLDSKSRVLTITPWNHSSQLPVKSPHRSLRRIGRSEERVISLRSLSDWAVLISVADSQPLTPSGEGGYLGRWTGGSLETRSHRDLNSDRWIQSPEC